MIVGICLILVIVYAVSCFAWWKYISTAKSKGGIYFGNKVTGEEVFLVFCPLLNTLFSLIGWTCFYPKVRERNEVEWDKFFKIKK